MKNGKAESPGIISTTHPSSDKFVRFIVVTHREEKRTQKKGADRWEVGCRGGFKGNAAVKKVIWTYKQAKSNKPKGRLSVVSPKSEMSKSESV